MAITKLVDIDKNHFAGGSHITDTISDEDLAELINRLQDKTDEIIDKVNTMPDSMETQTVTVAGAAFVNVTYTGTYAVAPKAIAVAKGNVNVWISNETTTGCRVNFSAAYTGDVNVLASL